MRFKFGAELLGLLAGFILVIFFVQLKHTSTINKKFNVSPLIDKLISVNYSPYEAKPAIVHQAQFEELTKLADASNGIYGIYVKDLDQGSEYEYNAEENFFAASLYKVPVAIATMKSIEDEVITKDQLLIYLPNDYSEGSGVIVRSKYNSAYEVDALLDKLLKNSDNVAQNILLRTIPQETVLESTRNFTNDDYSSLIGQYSTPKEIATVFINLHDIQEASVLEDNYITQQNASSILEKMQSTSFDNRISQGLNNRTVFSHKIGNWGTTGTWHDCGIVYGKTDYVVCVMSSDTNYKEFLNVTKATGEFIEEIN